ncbi:MAG: HlyD family efflux transporter periplasmic adaptor subunit [Pseudomonadales bacterium]|nr:HlyD family efflux transporter periplasmic adaptor subunit [Pseudomonadales bacterium]
MTDPVDSRPLFRSEPLRWRHDPAGVPVRWTGRFTGLAALLLALLAIVGLAWALAAPFARSVTLQGRIVSGAGALELYPAQRGTVTGVHAAPGVRIAAGAPLLTLERLQAVAPDRSLHETLAEQYRHELALLAAEARAIVADGARAATVLAARAMRLRRELDALDARRMLADQRLALRRDRLARVGRAAASGALPEFAVLESEDAVLAGEDERTALLAAGLARRAELDEIGAEDDQRRLETRAALLRLARTRAELERRYLGDRAANIEVLRAPRAGTVTAVAAGIGAAVAPDQPLVVLAPVDAAPAARLWLPAHAAIDIVPGQVVRVAVDAYPMHRHGALAGVVIAVQLLSATEPQAGYRVDVALDARSAGFAVRDGQSVSADIVLETRTLWDAVRAPFDRVRMRG